MLRAIRENYTTTPGKETVFVKWLARECSVQSRHDLVLESPVKLAFTFPSPGSMRNNNNNIPHNHQHLGRLGLRDT